MEQHFVDFGEPELRHLPRVWTLARRSPHRGPRAVHGVNGKSQPERTPDHVRKGVHALRQNVRERRRKDLLLAPFPSQHESEAARSAKAKGVPGRDLLEIHFLPLDHHVYLITRRRIRSATAGGQDGVRLDAVRDHGRVFLEREAVADHLDRALTLPQITTNPRLGCRRREEELLIHHSRM